MALTLLCGACGLLIAPPAVAWARVDNGFRTTASGAPCTPYYAYAGAQDSSVRAGMRADIRATTQPRVESGAVAAWVGIGGRRLGPNRTDMWLQTGYADFQGMAQPQIYYELTEPNVPTKYHAVVSAVPAGETHQIGLVEVKGKPNYWQVRVDGRAASPVIYLPRSHARFAPQALAETWNAGTDKCNHYSWTFASIRASRVKDGSWTTPKAGYVFRSVHNQAIKLAPATFLARSLAVRATAKAATRDVPPLLGPLASKLAGRHLSAECAAQRAAVREGPVGHIFLSKDVCETLLGYLVSQPWAPEPESKPGLIVVGTALEFLRGIARVARVRAADVDCRAVGWFTQAMHTLGATTAQAVALRESLLRNRGRLQPELSFQPSCRFR